MTKNSYSKSQVRQRMAQTGESFMDASRAREAERSRIRDEISAHEVDELSQREKRELLEHMEKTGDSYAEAKHLLQLSGRVDLTTPTYRRKQKIKDLIAIHTHIAAYGSMHMSLLQVMTSVSEDFDGEFFGDQLSAISRGLSDGVPLEELQKAHSDVLPKIFLRIVSSGAEIERASAAAINLFRNELSFL